MLFDYFYFFLFTDIEEFNLRKMGRVVFFFFFCFCFGKLGFLVGKLLFSSFFLALLIGLNFSSWLAIFFFLIYVGGVLVLLYYIFSLSPKNSFLLKKFFVLVFFLVKYKFFLEERKSFSIFSEFIISFNDGFFVYFSVILLLSLWITTKLHSFKSSSLRLFF